MSTPYRDATQKLLSDFERKPELIEQLTEVTGSRTSAIQQVVSLTAPNFIMPGQPARPGQLAQGLSEWHSTLREDCSSRYRHLTQDQDGPSLDRKEANQDELLQTLQAIKRGVKAARDTNYQIARGTSLPRQTQEPLLPRFMLEEATS